MLTNVNNDIKSLFMLTHDLQYPKRVAPSQQCWKKWCRLSEGMYNHDMAEYIHDSDHVDKSQEENMSA